MLIVLATLVIDFVINLVLIFIIFLDMIFSNFWVKVAFYIEWKNSLVLMSISKLIQYSDTSISGILQDMKSNSLTSKIGFSYSGIDTSTSSSSVLKDDDSYFCSTTNTNKDANFFAVELKDRVLYPKGYVIQSFRNDDLYFLKSWKLYGSTFGFDWTLLHFKDDSNDLNRNMGRYRIKGGPFRFFKLVQTGPNNGSSNDDRYRLRLSYLDFFGYMTDSSIKINQKTCKTIYNKHVPMLYVLLLAS